VRRDRHDPVADSYRALRSVLNLAHHDRTDTSRAPVTLLLSSGSGDGKTTATANLAAAFIETGARTVAVNTDFRRPALSAMLDAADLGALAPEAPPNMPLTISKNVAGLRVYDERLIDSGASPSELARKVVRALPWLTNEFEEVLIDSAPVAMAAEILEFLPSADSIVVIVRLGHTRIESATRTAETLRALGVTEYLLVVIGGPGRHDDSYYYGSTGQTGPMHRGRGFAGETLRRLRQGTGSQHGDS